MNASIRCFIIGSVAHERRKFGRGLLSAALLLLSPLALAGNFSATELAEHVQLVKGPVGNTLVAEDSDGLILIEGVPASYADEYLDFVRELSGQQRIKALVNTHWHDESAGLNGPVAKLGGEVIAHANTRQWLGATIRRRGDTILHTPVPEDELPTTIFYDEYALPFRGGEIELGYMLQTHTDGDIYARFPQQDIFYAGPALREDDWNPVDESTNGFIGAMMDNYDALDPLIGENTTVVPISGELMDREDFTALVAMYKELTASMVELLRASRSAREVVIANPAAGLMPQWGDPSEFLDQGFRSYYGHLRSTRHVGVMP